MPDLLVHFDNTAAAEQRLRLALSVARASQTSEQARSTVDGIYALPGIRVPVPSMSHILSEAEVEDLLSAPHVQHDRARQRFETLAREAGVAARWRAGVPLAPVLICRHAPYADLIVLERPCDDGELSHADVYEVVLHSRRPVLAVPRETDGDAALARVLVAWNGTREAARAVLDARAFLDRAEHVSVVTVVEEPGPGPGQESAETLVAYLRRRGIDASSTEMTADPGEAGRALLAAAKRERADLLVMGAFGHSRLFEYWVGGATRDVLDLAQLPVLLAR